MYDITIGKYAPETGENLFSEQTQIKVDKIMFCNWEEHCVECSPPYCYHNCAIYESRIDGRCVRIQNGIQMVRGIDGVRGYGIKCEFRKWAKLETIYSGRLLILWRDLMYDKINRMIARLCKGKYSYKLIDGCRRHLFSWAKARIPEEFDFFYVDCFLSNKDNVQLLVQMDNAERIIYTHIFRLTKGENVLKIAPPKGLSVGSRIFITPIEETNTIIYFRWLDFVKVKEHSNALTDMKEDLFADKVKVVAWDLDNTLWKGTLINNDKIEINQDALKVIQEFDKRGILNTICSKNDYSVATAKLRELGIIDYFLYPAINWGQKSENLKAIAQQLNLGINAFAFIDDNVREREEVKQALPMVRVFSDTEITSLLNKDCFDVPITETSSKRRLLYMEDAERNELKAYYNNNYDDFLRSLGMVLTVEYVDYNNKERCYELLSRSNQLNLSTNRYTREEYDCLLSNHHNVCLAFRVSDKFGDYGIVAFMSLSIQQSTAKIIDFVISCRIAKKKVENAIIFSLRDLLGNKGVKSIVADLIKTKKNSPLIDVFKELPFVTLSENSESIQYQLNNLSTIGDEGIIQIKRV